MKKIFKTLFSLLVVLGLVSVMVACDKTEEPTEEPTVEETPTPTPEPQLPEKTYHVVGGYFDDWNNYTDENKMTKISVDDLDASLKSKLLDKEITAIVKFEGRVFNVGPAWTANANIDGEVVTMNGGYTIKVVRAVYDEEDDNTFADQWLPDPKTACVANLTPDTLYMPKWVETPAEGEEGLGTWADNPVVIGGAGEYTVIFVEYAGANSADSPKYAMALIKTKELEEPKTTAELIADEHAALVAGTVTEATEFEEVAATVTELETAENLDGGYDVKLIATLDEVTFALTFHTDDLTGLEKGKEVKFTGTIDHEAAAVVIGDYTEEIVFANPTVTWAKVGAPTGIYLKGDMNNWGNDAEGKPEEELKFNEAGNPEITVVIEAGKCFKVADATWTNVNLGYHDGLDATLVEDGGDGNIKAKLSIALTLTVVDGELEISRGRSSIYVRGGMNGWGAPAEYELRCNDEMLPEITIELEAGVEFKVASGTSDWQPFNFGSAAVETELTSAFDLTADNIKVVTAGTYVFTVVPDTTSETPAYKLVITAAE